jgi:hypothetical protein
MKPRKHGSASPSEAAKGSSTGSTPGAGAKITVWQGSSWSRPWSRSRSRAKQGHTSHDFIHPPAWLSRARDAAAAGEPDFLAARLYEFLSVVSVGQHAAVAMEMCLFDLNVVSAGRALTAITRFTVMGLVSSVAALAAAVVGGGGSGDWHDAAAAALLPLLAAASAVASFVFGKVKELVGELFRG